MRAAYHAARISFDDISTELENVARTPLQLLHLPSVACAVSTCRCYSMCSHRPPSFSRAAPSFPFRYTAPDQRWYRFPCGTRYREIHRYLRASIRRLFSLPTHNMLRASIPIFTFSVLFREGKAIAQRLSALSEPPLTIEISSDPYDYWSVTGRRAAQPPAPA